MKKNLPLLSAFFFLFTAASAQTTIVRDIAIEQMVKEVSADSLKSYISSLVALGTRNTLSTQTNTRRGIAAARTWVLNKFNQFATQSHGRLSAFIDTTTLQADKKRVDRATIPSTIIDQNADVVCLQELRIYHEESFGPVIGLYVERAPLKITPPGIAGRIFATAS